MGPGENKMNIEWRQSVSPIDYAAAVSEMEERVAAIREGRAPELIWLLEHPPIYTAGTSSKPGDLLDPDRFPVFETGRGGEHTYHGPGQRVVYLLLDLKARDGDVRGHVKRLEQWIIDSLEMLGVKGERREGRVGIWVSREGREDKVAALGVRVRKWVTYHGISINLAPDLSHYQGIVPCGISGHGVTSLKDLGNPATMGDLDLALAKTFQNIFEV